MKYTFIMALLYWCGQAHLYAQNITWSADIAPIVYEHCTSCHRPGEIGPFPLTNYDEAQSWATTMQYVTEIRYMPPWKADPGYGVKYMQENYLTDDEINMIKNWAEHGAPQGDPALEPPLPVFPTGSQVGTPDLVLSFATAHIHPGNGEDEYRYFVLPTGLTAHKDLVALEMRPGNTRVVHHALFWQDTTGASAELDAETPEYGYIPAVSAGGLGGVPGGITNLSNQLPGYVPGQHPNVLSNGIAQQLSPGCDLVLQVHYAPTSTDEVDSSTVNLFFADQPATRYVKSHIMLPFLGTLTNGPFILPPNQVKEFHGEWEITEEASLLSITPHMHNLGTHWRVYALTPAGDTIHLIRINDWDFNWQGTFNFQKLIHVPAHSIIHAYAGYDNTANNPSNPYNPPQLIGWGESTNAEMYFLPISWVSYQAGDENLVLDGNITDTQQPAFAFRKNKLYPVWPNPANGAVKIGYTLGQIAKVSIDIIDFQGHAIQQLAHDQLTYSGEHVQEWQITDPVPGIYLVRLVADGQVFTQKIVVY